jgi:hypothetical protein
MRAGAGRGTGVAPRIGVTAESPATAGGASGAPFSQSVSARSAPRFDLSLVFSATESRSYRARGSAAARVPGRNLHAAVARPPDRERYS